MHLVKSSAAIVWHVRNFLLGDFSLFSASLKFNVNWRILAPRNKAGEAN